VALRSITAIGVQVYYVEGGIQITELSGPATALQIGDVPEPPREHPMTPGSGVIVDVKAADWGKIIELETEWKKQQKYI